MNQYDSFDNRASAMSALADGELHLEDFAKAFDAHLQNPGAASCWDGYHLIGEVLRGGGPAAMRPAGDFALSIMQRLAEEEVRYPLRLASTPKMLPGIHRDIAPVAANDALRWKVIAGCASLAAVTVFGWASLGTGTAGMQGAMLAAVSAPTATLASSSQPSQSGSLVDAVAATSDRADQAEQPMLRSAELDQYLAAHGQMVGGSALQMPGSFVRNASFTGSGDAK